MSKYEPTDRVKQQIAQSFTYHPPKDDQQARYILLREKGEELAVAFSMFTPPSREQSVALRKLEEAIMYANAAIARNE